jgi:WD40 repeat protein
VRLYRGDGTPIGELAESDIGGRRFKIHRTAVRDVAFAPGGDFLVAVDDEGQVVRWSLDGSEQAVVLGNHQLSISDVEVAPGPTSDLSDETLVLTGSLDMTARLWGLETGKAVAVLGHDGALSSARFSRDGRRVFTFSERDGSVRLWSIEPISGLAYLLHHPDHVWNLNMVAAPTELAPDGGGLLLATAGFDGGVRVWRYARGLERTAPELLASFQDHTDRVRQVSFSVSGRLLASAGYDGTAYVHDLVSDGVCKLPIATEAGGEQVYNALFGPPTASAPDAKSSAQSAAQSTTGSGIKSTVGPDARPIVGSNSRPSWLLTTSDDPKRPVRLFSPRSCAPIDTGDALRHGGVAVESAAVRTLGARTLVATGDAAGTLRLLQQDAIGRWHKRCEFDAGIGAIGDISLSADGTLIGAAGTSNNAVLIAIENDHCAAPRYLDGHTGRVYSIDIAPNSKQLLTASLDKTARIWHRNGAPQAVLTGHQDRIYRAVFSPGDGRWALTASRDGSMRIWRTPAPAPDPPPVQSSN